MGSAGRAREARLRAQVERINRLMGEPPYLQWEQVKQAGDYRAYDRVFYGRLSNIVREAKAGTRAELVPHYQLWNGHRPPAPTLPVLQPSGPPPAEGTAPAVGLASTQSLLAQGFTAQLTASSRQLAAALAPSARTQDVCGEWKR